MTVHIFSGPYDPKISWEDLTGLGLVATVGGSGKNFSQELTALEKGYSLLIMEALVERLELIKKRRLEFVSDCEKFDDYLFNTRAVPMPSRADGECFVAVQADLYMPSRVLRPIQNNS